MRITPILACVVSILVLSASAAFAVERSVVTRGDLEASVAAASDRSEAGRQLVQDVLRSEPVRRAASEAGFDADRLAASAATLEGADLDRAVTQAKAVQEVLAGGAETVTIGVTTLIIVLLILIVVLLVD